MSHLNDAANFGCSMILGFLVLSLALALPWAVIVVVVFACFGPR